MTEVILAAFVGALVLWLLDPLLGSFLHAAAGYLLARFIPGMRPRNIAGDWQTTFLKNNEEFHEHAYVKQLVDRVWGSIFVKSTHTTYWFRGNIKHNVFVAVYDLKGSTQVDRGAFTLKLNDSGDKLTGRYCWTDSSTDNVNGDQYSWAKIQKE